MTAIRVLTWNLYHGRADPAAGRPLAAEFAATLAGWEWDVALLQEVPPWWPSRLGEICGAHARMALTSRNEGFAIRRAIASRNPDLLASYGGGANAILVRGIGITEQRKKLLTYLPERRNMHGVRLTSGDWVVNLHTSTHPPRQNAADLALASRSARAWAGGDPLILGGDFNARAPEIDGMVRVASNHVDHIFSDRRAAADKGELLDAGTLSDHRPLSVLLGHTTG